MSKKRTKPNGSHLEPATAGADFAARSSLVILRGAGELTRIHQRACAASLSRRHAAAKVLAAAPLQFAQFQPQFLREEVEAAVNYCGELAQSALGVQSELAACCSGMTGTQALFDAAHLLD